MLMECLNRMRYTSDSLDLWLLSRLVKLTFEAGGLTSPYINPQINNFLNADRCSIDTLD